MKIDYKKELETASKGMIMIHEPKLLRSNPPLIS